MEAYHLPHISYSRCENDLFAVSQATDLSRSVEDKRKLTEIHTQNTNWLVTVP